MAPSTMPPSIASSMHGSQPHPQARAAYRLSATPAQYWPAAPMLNRPTL